MGQPTSLINRGYTLT